MTAANDDGVAPTMRIAGLRRCVADVSRSIDFYRDALGFAPVALAASGDSAWLTLGGVGLELVPRGDGPVPAPAVAPDPRFQHAAIVAADMGAAVARLLRFAPAVISEGGPQRLPANTGGVTAFKFRDPDGHPLELIAFPPGVGDPRWQGSSGAAPTLGIDHFALVVTDVERSIDFYRRALHFRVVSRGLNRGEEQDRLDGLRGAEVDVIALAPESGPRTPHLELLGYRRPPFVRTPGSVSLADSDVVLLRSPGSTAEQHDPDGHRLLVGEETALPLWNNAGP